MRKKKWTEKHAQVTITKIRRKMQKKLSKQRKGKVNTKTPLDDYIDLLEFREELLDRPPRHVIIGWVDGPDAGE